MWRAVLPVGLVLAVGVAWGRPGAVVSNAMERLFPNGYVVLATGERQVPIGDGETASLVVLARPDEEALKAKGESPARPLLVFAQGADGRVRLMARNDGVVMHIDEGGQCDPFLDGDGVVAVRGGYFTVQNGVACGSHWTDYVTFRFDARLGAFVFDNEIRESWRLNSSNDPGAEALVRDGKRRVMRGDARRVVRFEDWRFRR